jgi:hypothetical protein
MPYITKAEAKKKKIKSNSLQTILIPRNDFTLEQARKWIENNKKKHHYKYGYHRTTSHYFRFMQENPVIGATYYTITLPNKIHLVYQEF